VFFGLSLLWSYDNEVKYRKKNDEGEDLGENIHKMAPVFVNLVVSHCNKTILKGLIGSFAFSLPIVFAHFGLESPATNSLFALGAFYLLLTFGAAQMAWLGFFVGVTLYYWVSFSFYYFDMPYLIPFVVVAEGALYGAIFWTFAKLCEYAKQYNIYARAILVVFLFDYITLFGFNWFKPELFLVDSYFGVSKLTLAGIFAALTLFVSPQGRKRYLALLILPFCMEFTGEKPLAPISIFTASTSLKFEQKYDKTAIQNNFNIIQKAIDGKYDLVVLPETAFAYPLNKSDILMDALKEKSYEIAILCGSLRIDGNDSYNTNYLFVNGEVSMLDKFIGVPFGEVNPLPEFLSEFVNKIFFNGASDYKTAKNYSDFEVGGVKFRNAICYEATKEELYADHPSFMIALSNNAWFMPSVEPTIQKKLLKYYSKRFGTVIYHSVNQSGSYIVR
jgi:apolipoprotein N-acyltransferase